MIPIQIKSSGTFHADFLKKLHFFQKLAGDRAPTGYLFYAGDAQQRIGSIELIHYKNAAKIFSQDYTYTIYQK